PAVVASSACSAATDACARVAARTTSSAMTLPEPSQMEFSGDSRYRRGSPLSSTYPLPPRHSSASATTVTVRLHTQYFAAGIARRANARSSSSTVRASRRNRAVAAADSTQSLGRLEARCHQNRVSREPVHLRHGRWHVLDLVRRHG